MSEPPARADETELRGRPAMTLAWGLSSQAAQVWSRVGYGTLALAGLGHAVTPVLTLMLMLVVGGSCTFFGLQSARSRIGQVMVRAQRRIAVYQPPVEGGFREAPKPGEVEVDGARFSLRGVRRIVVDRSESMGRHGSIQHSFIVYLVLASEVILVSTHFTREEATESAADLSRLLDVPVAETENLWMSRVSIGPLLLALLQLALCIGGALAAALTSSIASSVTTSMLVAMALYATRVVLRALCGYNPSSDESVRAAFENGVAT